MIKSLPAGGRTRRAFLAATAWMLCAASSNDFNVDVLAGSESIRWIAFYGAAADASVLAAYHIVVLDPGFQGSIGPIAQAGARVCGYLSLGDVRTSEPSWHVLDRAALLQENADWPGTWHVDVRHPAWRSFILDTQVPRLVSRGFTGLMLDTLDTPPFLEQTDPAGCRGMRASAIDLVHSIRIGWPALTIVMNRGYALLPDLVQDIDAVVAESLLTTIDRNGVFRWLDAGDVEAQLALLQPAARKQPSLPVLSLDYWDPNDRDTIAAIYRRERELGHHPYVATKLLDRIMPEPAQSRNPI